MSLINLKLSLFMRVPRFPPVIMFVTSKGESGGIFQVMLQFASLQPLKPQARRHISFSMRKMKLKRCKRLDAFLPCLINWRSKIKVNPRCPLSPKKGRCFLSSLVFPLDKGSTVMTPYARNIIVSCLIFGSLDSVINDWNNVCISPDKENVN